MNDDSESQSSKVMSTIARGNPHSIKVKDRDLSVLCELDENVFRLSVAPSTGEDDHFLRIEFTKDFARELQTFLNEQFNGSDPVAE